MLSINFTNVIWRSIICQPWIICELVDCMIHQSMVLPVHLLHKSRSLSSSIASMTDGINKHLGTVLFPVLVNHYVKL